MAMKPSFISPEIVVVGSCNTDMIIRTDRFPSPGETVLGGSSMMEPGGKGGNQAIAAARQGGNVTLVSKIGYDIFGLQAMELFRNENITTTHVLTDVANPSGLAMVTVNAQGENYIIVAPGANATLSLHDIDKAQTCIQKADILIVQLEIPMTTVEYALRLASAAGVRSIMKPAPVTSELTDSIVSNLFAILPNRIEAQHLSGIEISDIESAKAAAQLIGSKGVANVIITLGADGVLVKEGESFSHLPAHQVKVVDTTGAGDVFCGAFGVEISRGQSLMQAVAYANAAAALSVTHLGAQKAIPSRAEVEAILQ